MTFQCRGRSSLLLRRNSEDRRAQRGDRHHHQDVALLRHQRVAARDRADREQHQQRRDGGALALDCIAETTATLTADEVARAKAQLKVSLLVAMESSSSRAEQIARQHMAYGRLIGTEEILREVDAVTVESARAAGAAMIRSAPTVSAIGTRGSSMWA